MAKSSIFSIVMVGGIALAVALLYHRHAGPSLAVHSENSPRVGGVAPTPPVAVASPRPTPVVTFEQKIRDLGRQHGSTEELAALLKSLYAEDPQKLFDALLAIGNGSLETRQRLLPILAQALTLWPDAEGRYVFPVADAYGEIDLPGAAEWAATYLAKTGRDDLAAATLVARLVETSEARALAMVAGLPEAAHAGALEALAYHIRLDDLDHLREVCLSLDPQGSASFSKLLFDRLGSERPDEAAAWLAATPAAAALPGAVSAIAQAMVRSTDPKKAIAWADSLPDGLVRAQAITSVYQQWARSNPESAIEDILNAYGGAPMLMADVFKGSTEHHGSGPATYWDTASKLENPSARAYAFSALIEPVLLTMGQAEIQARIGALAPGSLERNVAELALQNALKKSSVTYQLQNRANNTGGMPAGSP